MLRLDNVGFEYGIWRKTVALHELCWSVLPGKRTVLLGPNGAGKTTLLKVLSGFSVPNSGHIIGSNGKHLGRQELQKRIAWMPQEISVIRGMTVLQQVAYSSWLAGHSRASAEALAADALGQVLLHDKLDEGSHTLSGGQRRRMGLAEALAKDSDIILLDEPTAGLDPAQRKNFKEIVRGIEPNRTIVVSTHQVDDLDELFDQVAVLANGQMAFDGTVDSFRRAGEAANQSPEAIFSQIVNGGLH